jgi:hypothetical protein
MLSAVAPCPQLFPLIYVSQLSIVAVVMIFLSIGCWLEKRDEK